MNVKNVEKENGKAVVTLEIGAAEFESALNKAYLKLKKSIQVPGFRKGKAPRKIVESLYGPEVFYEDAIEGIFPEIYTAAIVDQNLKAVGQPSMVNMEKNEEGAMVLTIATELYPEVTLGQYKGLEVTKAEAVVTDEEIAADLNRMAEQNARIATVERAAKNGDTVVLDFEGFVDGVPFEGGKANGHNLELGSGAFIPGFEEQLVGCAAGEEKDVVVTFPEEYEPSLAGKEATFKCKVNEVKVSELPVLDDEFVKDVSEFDTVEEYKNSIRENLKAARQAQADDAWKNKLLDAVNLLDKLADTIFEVTGSGAVEGFVYYAGTYTLTSTNTADLDLGTAVFTATCDGVTETYTSGNITCLKAPELDGWDEEATPEGGKYINVGSGYICEIITYSAETFDGRTTDEFSRPTNNYLPEGTVDYCSTELVNGRYALLRSGHRVYVEKKNKGRLIEKT